jgi:hypothetical protein
MPATMDPFVLGGSSRGAVNGVDIFFMNMR